MRSYVIICLGVAAIILSQSTSHACSSSPPPYFDIPTYIDPDYKVPGYSEVRYGRKRMFEILLSRCATLGSGQEILDDSHAREISQHEEASRYSAYQQGATLFRELDYSGALKIFTELKDTAGAYTTATTEGSGKNSHSWVREASSYMVARCQLIIAQDTWNGYGDPILSVDQEMLRSADSLYLQYLKDFPDGIYANSAHNIRRKIYFLSGKQTLLDQELKQAMLEQFPVAGTSSTGGSVNRNTIEEFENHFRGDVDFAHDSPVLAAYAWLGTQEPNPHDVIVLEAREKDFSAYPGLFRYVRALGLYRLQRYQELLEKTPEEQPGGNGLWLSTQLLRARSQAKVGDQSGALTTLEQMHRVSPEDAVEVEIASLRLNNGDGLWLYTDGSSIVSEKNLRAVATFGLSDRELEIGVIGNVNSDFRRKILVEELARRYILSGRFAELTGLLNKEQLPVFAPAGLIIADLVSNPRNVAALVDLGEFLYNSYITPRASFAGYRAQLWIGYALADLAPHCIPCREFDKRTALYTSPMALFQRAVQLSRESHQRSESEAKALHYIVLAARLGHWRDQCTWNTSPGVDTYEERSKKAFLRLHRLYKNSPWTTATPYYY
jgi:hypothetical protein